MADPSLLRQHAEEAGARLPPLLVAAERVAATVAQGVHGRRRVGTGETFWQFRQYQPGDAAQRIDWRESAKSQRLYVRETEWEAAQSVYLWRDGSASMDYASSRGVPTKRARADLVTLALAVLLVRGGERVALLGTAIGPSHGRALLERLALALGRGEEGAGMPPVVPLPRHAQIVLIGDLLAPPAETQALVARYVADGVKGYLLQIVDPAEEDFPFAGRIRFEGLEREDPILVSRAEAVRDTYAERLKQHRAALETIARGAGWGVGIHRTDHSVAAALLAVYAALAPERGWR